MNGTLEVDILSTDCRLDYLAFFNFTYCWSSWSSIFFLFPENMRPVSGWFLMV